MKCPALSGLCKCSHIASDHKETWAPYFIKRGPADDFPVSFIEKASWPCSKCDCAAFSSLSPMVFDAL